MNFDINEEIKSNNQIEDNVNESKILLYFKDECWIEIYSNEKLIHLEIRVASGSPPTQKP